jgi:hypothetical protein
MPAVYLCIPPGKNKQAGQAVYPSREILDKVERGLIGPMDVFKNEDWGPCLLLQVIAKSHEAIRLAAFLGKGKRKPGRVLPGNIVQRGQRMRCKKVVAIANQLHGGTLDPLKKLLYQSRFPDTRLPYYKYRISLTRNRLVIYILKMHQKMFPLQQFHIKMGNGVVQNREFSL